MANSNKQHSYQSPVSLGLLLLLIGTAIAIHQFKVPPIMDQISCSVGLSQVNSPWLMSIFLLICLIFSIPAGFLVQQMRAKPVFLLSAALIIAGSIMGAMSDSAAPLLISRGVEGLGFLIISVALPVAAVVNADPKKIGTVMGICIVWISTGQIAAFNTVPKLIGPIGWKGIWWVYALFTIAAILFFMLAFKEKSNEKNGEGDISIKNISLADAFKNKNLIFPSIGFLVYNFCLMTVVTFFPGYATSNGLLSLSKASFIASLPMILCLIGSPALGRLADRYSHKWLYSLTLFCGGIGSALMFTKSITTIILGAAILGFIGAATPCLMFSSLGKLVASDALLAKSNGIVVLFQNAGMFLATLTFGFFVRVLEGNYTLAAVILIPMAIISVILVFFTRYRETPAN